MVVVTGETEGGVRQPFILFYYGKDGKRVASGWAEGAYYSLCGCRLSPADTCCHFSTTAALVRFKPTWSINLRKILNSKRGNKPGTEGVAPKSTPLGTGDVCDWDAASHSHRTTSAEIHPYVNWLYSTSCLFFFSGATASTEQIFWAIEEERGETIDGSVLALVALQSS
jgi:hypothetical protein